jgi:hypothetical protein
MLLQQIDALPANSATLHIVLLYINKFQQACPDYRKLTAMDLLKIETEMGRIMVRGILNNINIT